MGTRPAGIVVTRATYNPGTPYLTTLRESYIDRDRDGYLNVEAVLADTFEAQGVSPALLAAILRGPMAIDPADLADAERVPA